MSTIKIIKEALDALPERRSKKIDRRGDRIRLYILKHLRDHGVRMTQHHTQVEQLEAMLSAMANNTELLKNYAAITATIFNEYLALGFSRAEAMELVVKLRGPSTSYVRQ